MVNFLPSALIVILAITSVDCFYEAGSKVHVLTNDNFESLVLDSEDIWLVEFYAPWCGHCKKMTPEFEKAAKALEGIVKLGAVDMTTDGEAGQDYGIQGYPTLKFFAKDKKEPIAFEGDRKKGPMIEYCLERAREFALSRLGVSVNSSSTSSGGLDEKDVVVLTDSSFEEQVYNSELPWLIEFYAPWCKHCKKLAPEWAKLATKLKGQFNIGKVDATVETTIAQNFKIEGFPSLKYFPSGSSEDDKPEEYGGDREFAELYAFAKKKLTLKITPQKKPEKVKSVPSIENLADQKTFERQCSNGVTCVLTFVPALPVSSNDERSHYLQIIQDTQNEAKQPNFTYLWVTGGDFEEFEAEVNVLGSSYPVTVAINTSKDQYYNHRGSFTSESLTQFVNQVASGREQASDYSDLPSLTASRNRDDL